MMDSGAEETQMDGQQKMDGRDGHEERTISFTTLSTIAVQAGQSEMVVSVLQSGSVVHLHLVQVQPALCEIGSNQEENQTLLREQLQLMDTLKKHEHDVLAVVEESQRRKRRDWMLTQRDGEEGVYKAMGSSLSEGWSLLLHLLNKRQEVLKLASEFYCRVLEFSISMDRCEDHQFGAEDGQLKSMRRDVLKKSLLVLTSSSVLLQKLQWLQRIEALQRTGTLLQDEEEEESSQGSRGVALKLEELVEVLQDRRRRLDWATGSQCQQGWSLSVDQIAEQHLQSGSTSNLHPGSISVKNKDLSPNSRSDETRNLQPESISEKNKDLNSEARSEQIRDLSKLAGFDKDLQEESKTGKTTYIRSGSKSDKTGNLWSGSRPEKITDLESRSRPEKTKDLQTKFTSEKTRDLQSGYIPEKATDCELGSRPEMTGDLSRSRAEKTTDFESGSRQERIKELQSEFRAETTTYIESGSNIEKKEDLQTKSRESDDTRDLQSWFRSDDTRDLQSGSRSDDTRDLQSGSRSDNTRDLQTKSRESDDTRDLQSGSRSDNTRDLQTKSRESDDNRDLQSGSRSDDTRDLQSGSRSDDIRDLQFGSRADDTRDLQSGSRSDNTRDLQTKSRESDDTRDFQSGSRSKDTRVLQSGSPVEETRSVAITTRRIKELHRILGNETESEQDLTQQTQLTNQKKELPWSLERFVKKSVGLDAENMKQVLDQIRPLHASRPSLYAPRDPSSPLSPLKNLTEQLKRGRWTRTSTTFADAPAAGSRSPELSSKVGLVELQSLNWKVDSHLLESFMTFLKKAQQVMEEMEEMRTMYRGTPEEVEEEEEEVHVRSPVMEVAWQQTLNRFITTQQLGNNCIQAATMDLRSGINLSSLVLAVQKALEKLSRIKQEVDKLQHQRQLQVQQEKYCRRYQDGLLKGLQDLTSITELLDYCTHIDLGSELQTSMLLERFNWARPHFTQLSSEVEFVEKTWDTLRMLRDRLKEVPSRAVKERGLSELLNLHQRVRSMIHQTETILNLTSRFHLTSHQLEELLRSHMRSPSNGSAAVLDQAGSELSLLIEKQQEVHNLFTTASTLKADICSAIRTSGWMGFRMQKLEAHLASLGSLWGSWLKDSAPRRVQTHGAQLTGQMTGQVTDDIRQLCDSFKTLKRYFTNLKFNYLKRRDRTRSVKAVQKQLKQLVLYEDRLQVLRERVQIVTAQLGSEVRDGSTAQALQDASSELQTQIEDLELSLSEHQKTLEMSYRLQQALAEFGCWCKEASTTIAGVRTLSWRCSSAKGVSILQQQLQTLVWPTVPQQEERLWQIRQLAVTVHGLQEGQQIVQETVSQHSEMVESIRDLSDGLLELENKLKLEAQSDGVKKDKTDGWKEKKAEEEPEEMARDEDEEGDEGKNEEEKKETQKRRDNGSRREAVREKKHAPKVIAEHDGKVDSVKASANGKPLSQKGCVQEDRQTSVSDRSQTETLTSSLCFSLSCGPVGASRRVNAIHHQTHDTAQPQAAPPQGASTAGLPEVELQQQEVMPEDALSNDEYECVSPDDISLPSLAETPESTMVQSDVEEGLCSSSYGVHINQHSHQCQFQSEPSGTITISDPPQRESLQSETPPNRFMSQTSSFDQCRMAVPVQVSITSSLPTVIHTVTETDPMRANLSLRLAPGYNRVHSSQNCYSNKDIDIPKKRSPSQTEPSMQEHTRNKVQFQSLTGTLDKMNHKVLSNDDALILTAELNRSPTLHQSCYCIQLFNGSSPNIHKDKTHDTGLTIFPQDINTEQLLSDFRIGLIKDETSSQVTVHKCSDKFPQWRKSLRTPSSSTDSQNGLCHDINSYQTREEPSLACPSDSCTLIRASSRLDSTAERALCQSGTTPQIGPVHDAREIPQSPRLVVPVVHNDGTQELKSVPEDISVSQTHSESRTYLSLPCSQTSNETPLISMSQYRNLNLAPTITKKHLFCQSSLPNRQCNVPLDDVRSLGEVHVPVLPETSSFESNSISSRSSTNSDVFGSEQHHQTVYSLHESMNSICTQQSVCEPSMTPIKPISPPVPESQALPQQVDPHEALWSSSPHLPTQDQDPSLCQPIAIREGIRLTPQIKGPPFPAPHSPLQVQTESLLQGKASKASPPSFSRPLSRATVMEGSPVTLEVEVTGLLEPTLTWSHCGGLSAISRPPLAEEEASGDTGEAGDTGETGEARDTGEAGHGGDSGDTTEAGHGGDTGETGHGGDSGEMCLEEQEKLSIITGDWNKWFGTLCVLLWLLYLIVI
ncbi:coiled-coil domain-containing protein 141-like [Antennarius striatus]|uniref:coiled-coil domain-containing protein 141-like n=1 Tax=Antennarius striatus TaxID=241820 RepID=UPI0035B001F0